MSGRGTTAAKGSKPAISDSELQGGGMGSSSDSKQAQYISNSIKGKFKPHAIQNLSKRKTFIPTLGN